MVCSISARGSFWSQKSVIEVGDETFAILNTREREEYIPCADVSVENAFREQMLMTYQTCVSVS